MASFTTVMIAFGYLLILIASFAALPAVPKSLAALATFLEAAVDNAVRLSNAVSPAVIATYSPAVLEDRVPMVGLAAAMMSAAVCAFCVSSPKGMKLALTLVRPVVCFGLVTVYIVALDLWEKTVRAVTSVAVKTFGTCARWSKKGTGAAAYASLTVFRAVMVSSRMVLGAANLVVMKSFRFFVAVSKLIARCVVVVAMIALRLFQFVVAVILCIANLVVDWSNLDLKERHAVRLGLESHKALHTDLVEKCRFLDLEIRDICEQSRKAYNDLMTINKDRAEHLHLLTWNDYRPLGFKSRLARAARVSATIAIYDRTIAENNKNYEALATWKALCRDSLYLLKSIILSYPNRPGMSVLSDTLDFGRPKSAFGAQVEAVFSREDSENLSRRIEARNTLRRLQRVFLGAVRAPVGQTESDPVPAPVVTAPEAPVPEVVDTVKECPVAADEAAPLTVADEPIATEAVNPSVLDSRPAPVVLEPEMDPVQELIARANQQFEYNQMAQQQQAQYERERQMYLERSSLVAEAKARAEAEAEAARQENLRFMQQRADDYNRDVQNRRQMMAQYAQAEAERRASEEAAVLAEQRRIEEEAAALAAQQEMVRIQEMERRQKEEEEERRRLEEELREELRRQEETDRLLAEEVTRALAEAYQQLERERTERERLEREEAAHLAQEAAQAQQREPAAQAVPEIVLPDLPAYLQDSDSSVSDADDVSEDEDDADAAHEEDLVAWAERAEEAWFAEQQESPAPLYGPETFSSPVNQQAVIEAARRPPSDDDQSDREEVSDDDAQEGGSWKDVVHGATTTRTAGPFRVNATSAANVQTPQRRILRPRGPISQLQARLDRSDPLAALRAYEPALARSVEHLQPTTPVRRPAAAQQPSAPSTPASPGSLNVFMIPPGQSAAGPMMGRYQPTRPSLLRVSISPASPMAQDLEPSPADKAKKELAEKLKLESERLDAKEKAEAAAGSAPSSSTAAQGAATPGGTTFRRPGTGVRTNLKIRRPAPAVFIKTSRPRATAKGKQPTPASSEGNNGGSSSSGASNDNDTEMS